MRKTSQGFTLIELMIAVVVVAILSSIAIPSYTSYVRRGKIVEAHSMLSNYRVQMEQYFQDNRNYGAAGTGCGVAQPTGSAFSVSCAITATGFTATAKNLAGKGLDAVGTYTFTIDESGNRVTTAFKNATVPANCWLLKEGSSC